MTETTNLFSIELTAKSRELMRLLEKHAKGLSIKNSMESIGRSYRKEVKRIFLRKQVRKPALKWDDLKEKTIAQKLKFGLSERRANRALDRTGKLRHSMTRKNNADNISNVTHKSAEFGTTTPYGNYHDDIKSSRKKLPLRNFSIPSETTYGTFLRIIDEDIINQLDKIGIETE